MRNVTNFRLTKSLEKTTLAHQMTIHLWLRRGSETSPNGKKTKHTTVIDEGVCPSSGGGGGGGCLSRGVAGPPTAECLAHKPTVAECRHLKDEATLLDDNARNTAFPSTFVTDFKWAEGGALIAGCLVGGLPTVEGGPTFLAGCGAGASGTATNAEVQGGIMIGAFLQGEK